MANLHTALAKARIRQWAAARQRVKAGYRPAIAQLRGRATHTNRDTAANAAITFCIDFERALSQLSEVESAMLVLRYRDGLRQSTVAEMLNRSTRWLGYAEDAALAKLAAVLERMDLL